MNGIRTTPAAGGYTLTAKIVHWLVAVAVIGLILVGLSLDSIPKGPSQDLAYFLHKSTGVVVLALMTARIAWRLTNPPPPSEPDLARWQVRLSHAVHWTLYAILLVMPVLGWAGSNAFGAPVSVFGLFTMPTLLAEDKELAKQILGWHARLGITAGLLIVLHIAAALYHRFVRHDAVLARMM
ncbi:MAG TPA: cytochrome b [Hansschlegelia sp.]